MVRSCRSASHRQLKEKARGRVGELQGILADLQLARKESRTSDVVLLEEYVHRVLGDWKTELSDVSPASSLLGNCCASPALSSEIQRMLQMYEEEEEDDATSNFVELQKLPDLKPLAGDELKQKDQGFQIEGAVELQEIYNATKVFPELELLTCDQCKDTALVGPEDEVLNCPEIISPVGYHQQFSLQQWLPHNAFLYLDTSKKSGANILPRVSGFVPALCLPPPASSRPKCALWDCPRPAQGMDWYHEYCSSFHATLAFNEGPPGMTPVLRPGGIDLKDGPLFAALSGKTQGKNVGIPECQGAATAKSPWNAPELFDLIVLEGESLREWLFFDKPRRAFENGNRKQRSLPDYNGRGWHESRKQVMKEFGGLKRSYYMDPQPLCHFEWHLYEYEININDSCSLFRLELKLVEAKRAKSKVSTDSLADLQQQMKRLNAESTVDNKRGVDSWMKVNEDEMVDHVYETSDILNTEEIVRRSSDYFQVMDSMSGGLVYGPNMPFSYSSFETSNNIYGT